MSLVDDEVDLISDNKVNNNGDNNASSSQYVKLIINFICLSMTSDLIFQVVVPSMMEM